MHFELVLEIFGIAISLGGFLGVFLPRERLRAVLLLAVAAFLALTSGVSLYLGHQHKLGVETVEKSIQSNLGSERKSFDQLYESLFFVEASVVSEALEELVRRGKVGQEILDLQDGQGTKFRVRIYYLMSSTRVD
jgi:hypothetical protein